MFCTKCGREITSPIGKCEYCSDSVEIKQENIFPAMETIHEASTFPTNPKPRNTKKIMLSVAAIVVVIALLAFGVKAALNLMKTPKQLYMEIEQANITEMINNSKELYKNEFDASLKNLKEKPYECKTEFSLGADLKSIPGIPPMYSSLISSTLDKLKITSDSKVDSLKKQSVSNLQVLVKDKSLINATVFQKDKQFGVSIPELYSKYFTIDGANLKSLYKNLGIPEDSNTPTKLITNDDILNAVKINKTDVSTLLKKYGKFYYDNINSESITLDKNSIFEANGEQMNCQKFTVTLTEKQLKDLVFNLYDTISQDDMLLEMTYGNFVSVLNLYKDAGYFNSSMDQYNDLVNKGKLKENLSKFKDTLKSELDTAKFPKGLKMTLWVDKDQHILNRKIEADIASDSETVSMSLDMKSWTAKGDKSVNNTLEFLMTPQKEKGKLDFKYVSKSLHNELNSTGNNKTSFDFILETEDTQVAKFNLNIDSNDVKDKAAKTGRNDTTFDFTIGSSDQDLKGSGQVITNSWSKDSNKNKGYDSAFKISIDNPDGSGDKISFNANLKQDYTFGVDVKLPEINSSNSVNLNTVDPTELEGIGQEIQGTLVKLFMENSDLFSE